MRTCDDLLVLRFRAFMLLTADRAGDAEQVRVQRRAAAIEGITDADLDDELALLGVELPWAGALATAAHRVMQRLRGVAQNDTLGGDDGA